MDGWLSIRDAIIESFVDDFFLILAVDDDVFVVFAVIGLGLFLGLQAGTGFGLFNGVAHYNMILLIKCNKMDEQLPFYHNICLESRSSRTKNGSSLLLLHVR